MDGICGLIKEARGDPLPLAPREDIVTRHHLGSRMPSPNTRSAGTMILDFPATRTLRNKCLWLIRHPVCDVMLQQPKCTRQMGSLVLQ